MNAETKYDRSEVLSIKRDNRNIGNLVSESAIKLAREVEREVLRDDNIKISDNNYSTILSRIALADKSAAIECVDIYGGMIWALTKKYTDSAADAEKIVQEIFTDIWENAGRCNLSMSDEKVWIALIARRRLSKSTVLK